MRQSEIPVSQWLKAFFFVPTPCSLQISWGSYTHWHASYLQISLDLQQKTGCGDVCPCSYTCRLFPGRPSHSLAEVHSQAGKERSPKDGPLPVLRLYLTTSRRCFRPALFSSSSLLFLLCMAVQMPELWVPGLELLCVLTDGAALPCGTIS